MKGVLRQHPCDTGDDPEDWRLPRCRDVRIERELLMGVLELREMLGFRHCGRGCGCCAEMFEAKLFPQPRVACATNLNSTYSMPLRLKLETVGCLSNSGLYSLQPKKYPQGYMYLSYGLISTASDRLFFCLPGTLICPTFYPLDRKSMLKAKQVES